MNVANERLFSSRLASGLLTLVVQFRFLERLVDQIKDYRKIFPLIVGREDHRVKHIASNEETLAAMTCNHKETEEVVFIVACEAINLKLNKIVHNGRSSVRQPSEHPFRNEDRADENDFDLSCASFMT